MHDTEQQAWRDNVVLARDIDSPGERSEFFTQARRGEFTRIFRGVHVPTTVWLALGPDERHRAIVKAAAAFAGRELVFSHASAVGVWRLPWIGVWPDRAHVTVPTASGGRSKKMFVRHTTGVPEEIEHIEGIAVTTIARTVADIARTQPFGCAVTVADAALRRTTHPLTRVSTTHPLTRVSTTHSFTEVPRTGLIQEDIVRELQGIPIRQGVAKALRVIGFADARADRPGESMSRVSMMAARLPPPELQVVLAGATGRVWTVDFFWPIVGLIGEFDGQAKYTDPVFLRGRTPEQALSDEKDREDDLRAAGYDMSRWGWKLAMSPNLLRRHLMAAGLR
ncbi:MAG: hypothetical protein ABI238_02340 [Terrimesophilobacter sp.]